MKLRNILTMVIATAVFTAGFVFVSDSEVSAAKKPGMVRSLSITGITTNSATIKWSKVKGASGYDLYKNGKYFGTTGAGTRTYSDKSLKASTRYTYSVKAYKKVKQKQWYNKKTKKWQKKKPKKKYRGKSRKVTVKLYGASSKKCSFTTQGYTATWRVYGRTVRAEECPTSFVIDGTTCKRCGAGGMVATVTYTNHRFDASAKGIDYSKTCHHHDSYSILVCMGDATKDSPSLEAIKTSGMFFADVEAIELENDKDNYQDSNRIDPKTETETGNQTRKHHSHTYQGLTQDELADMKEKGNDVSCKATKRTRVLYCRNCEEIVFKPSDWK